METVSGALGGEDPGAMSLAELAVALGELSEDESVAQYRWLRCLAEFDRRQGWAADGALSCVDWLTRWCGLARRTAQERVRVAHELTRRPVLDEVFGSGMLRWCHVRAITRVIGAGDAVDRALVQVAQTGTVADVEAAVRYWELLQDQERPPPAERALRGQDVRMRSHAPGLSRVELVLPDARARAHG